jgi:hypothetical protein
MMTVTGVVVRLPSARLAVRPGGNTFGGEPPSSKIASLIVVRQGCSVKFGVDSTSLNITQKDATEVTVRELSGDGSKTAYHPPVIM